MLPASTVLRRPMVSTPSVCIIKRHYIRSAQHFTRLHKSISVNKYVSEHRQKQMRNKGK
jgi:hypothetical protein